MTARLVFVKTLDDMTGLLVGARESMIVAHGRTITVETQISAGSARCKIKSPGKPTCHPEAAFQAEGPLALYVGREATPRCALRRFAAPWIRRNTGVLHPEKRVQDDSAVGLREN